MLPFPSLLSNFDNQLQIKTLGLKSSSWLSSILLSDFPHSLSVPLYLACLCLSLCYPPIPWVFSQLVVGPGLRESCSISLESLSPQYSG